MADMFRHLKKRPPTVSERFGATLPPGPLVAHLTFLHSLLIHHGCGSDALEVGEHSLRQIAVYTQKDPRL
jgi:hypothetical protein